MSLKLSSGTNGTFIFSHSKDRYVAHSIVSTVEQISPVYLEIRKQ